MLNDDCLERTLDWLYSYDLTKLFARLAYQARGIFGVKAEQIHVDTTSFSMRSEYTCETDEPSDSEVAIIAKTYGYLRDHREHFKQWVVALATTHDWDILLFV